MSLEKYVLLCNHHSQSKYRRFLSLQEVASYSFVINQPWPNKNLIAINKY